MEKIEVAIAVPCAQVVEPKVLQSMMSLVSYSSEHGFRISEIGVTARQMVDDARNGLAEAFLASPVEWMFWMDSDMLFPPDTLAQLYKTAKDKESKLVTGVYYQRKGLNLPCLWVRGNDLSNGDKATINTIKGKANEYTGTFTFPHIDKKEPFPVHAAGFGCVLTHRSVFEKMDRPWFKFIQGVCSEDFYFFTEAQKLGYTLWANPVPVLAHLGDAPAITKHDFFAKMEKGKPQVAEVLFKKDEQTIPN